MSKDNIENLKDSAIAAFNAAKQASELLDKLFDLRLETVKKKLFLPSGKNNVNNYYLTLKDNSVDENLKRKNKFYLENAVFTKNIIVEFKNKNDSFSESDAETLENLKKILNLAEQDFCLYQQKVQLEKKKEIFSKFIELESLNKDNPSLDKFKQLNIEEELENYITLGILAEEAICEYEKFRSGQSCKSEIISDREKQEYILLNNKSGQIIPHITQEFPENLLPISSNFIGYDNNLDQIIKPTWYYGSEFIETLIQLIGLKQQNLTPHITSRVNVVMSVKAYDIQNSDGQNRPDKDPPANIIIRNTERFQLAPFNVCGNHWVTLLVDNYTKKIECLDARDDYKSAVEDEFDKLKKYYLTDDMKKNGAVNLEEYTFEYIAGGYQKDSNNCGPHMCDAIIVALKKIAALNEAEFNSKDKFDNYVEVISLREISQSLSEITSSKRMLERRIEYFDFFTKSLTNLAKKLNIKINDASANFAGEDCNISLPSISNQSQDQSILHRKRSNIFRNILPYLATGFFLASLLTMPVIISALGLASGASVIANVINSIPYIKPLVMACGSYSTSVVLGVMGIISLRLNPDSSKANIIKLVPATEKLNSDHDPELDIIIESADKSYLQNEIDRRNREQTELLLQL